MELWHYEEAERAILERYPTIRFLLRDRSYEIAIDLKNLVRGPNGWRTLGFPNPEDLLAAPVFDGRRLAEVWGEVVVERFDG